LTKGNHPIFTQGMKAESAVLSRELRAAPSFSARARAAALLVSLASACAEPQSQWTRARSPSPAEPGVAQTAQVGADANAGSAPKDDGASAPEDDGANAERAQAKPRVQVLALPVEGFGAAVVVAPLSDEPLPMLVAAHGAGDTPDWQCQHWGGVARGRFYVLCPRGLPLERGSDSAFFFSDHHALEREVAAMLRAARSAFGTRLAAKGGVYTGYSQGATMGALMVVDHGAEFQHLVLVEGGSGDWTLGRARRFQATGGRSVAIVCGTPGCASRGKRSQTLLERAGLRARVEHVEGGGHTYVGGVGDRARELLDGWLLEGN
jgi:predicted esterase